MDARRWAMIESLYDTALAKEPGERSSYLSQACREHPELQAEVESLLRCAGEELNSPLKDCSGPPGLLYDVAFAPARVGDKLGPYEIVAHIGSGGMGDVYKARDTRLDRTVAIKFSKAQFTERFEREARAVAALNHPHICQLYDVGPNYLVFEYIDGARLKGPMPAAETLQVAMQIADALAEAHAHGIIHRDLKPANILLTAHGVKVLDFGLAKRCREDEGTDVETLDLTRPGAVMGTPAYMAPEQWQGKPADNRSDIYAFGCVLYELLTGERPGRERIPLRQRELEAIVRGCVANDPDKRFQSAGELKSALSQAAQSRSRGKYAVVAAVVLLAALGATFLLKRGHAAPKLTDQDVLVVADFDNHTGDSVFDTALKQALAFQLQRSPLLKAMDDAEIRQALKLSGRSPDARVTGEIARDICIREGQKATLEGSIAVLGSRYLIGLQAVNCLTGETFAREQAEVAGKDQVVETLDRATNLMRAKLGESLQTIQAEDRAYKQQITTSSLEALQVFQMASAEWTRTGNDQAAIPLLRRATELDPNFAFAFAILGDWYQDTGDKAAAKQMTEKAYALKDHVSERERLFIEDRHYRDLGDLRKALEIEELLTRRYPRDPVFHSNQAVNYLRAGEPEKALAEAQAAIRNGPKIMAGYSIAVGLLWELDRLDEAKAMAVKAIANGLAVPWFHGDLLNIAVVAGDRQAQERETKWLMSNGAEAMTLLVQAYSAFATGHFKQAAKLIPKGIEMARRHPVGIPPSFYVERSQTANALVGRCLHGPAASQVVRALCDTNAAKKFVEQKAAGGENPISGPEAYIRGLALLAGHNSADAAAVFQQMIDRKAANLWGPEYAAAHVGLARAAKSTGDLPRARKAYEDFFAFWKDADPDIPLLLQARKEYAALK
jgi:eukaryotic-like serine/threonine-protein kinase